MYKFKKIVISGKQGSGKSTLARALKDWAVKHQWAGVIYKFADPLYEMQEAVRTVSQRYGLRMAEKDGKLLQLLGTDWGRGTFGEDVWVNVLKGRLASLEKIGEERSESMMIIIDDCRFPNEFHAMFDALRIRLAATKAERMARAHSWRDKDDHPSETALDDFSNQFDLVFDTGRTNVEIMVTEIIFKLGVS